MTDSNFLYFIIALSSNLSFEQQNQFVPLSAALAGSIQTDMSHLPENNNTMEEASFIFSLHVCIAFFFFFPLSEMPNFSMCTLSIKANSWIGLQYFLNYFNGLDIGQWGAGGEDSELIVLISPDDHLCVRGGE